MGMSFEGKKHNFSYVIQLWSKYMFKKYSILGLVGLYMVFETRVGMLI